VYYWELVPAAPEGGFLVRDLRSEIVSLTLANR
jgi:hypothetical protein